MGAAGAEENRLEEIAHWLSRLGLGAYAERFAANDIDLSVLRDLTDADLEALGMTLGHRRKLQRALADGDHAASSAEPHGERRQLTVMFVDLVGSTALAGRLDPEEMSALIRAYHADCARIISAFEGFTAQFLGDGVLAYFGYPTAHENAAERAVLAASDIIATLSRPQGDAPALSIRIGIATGLVVVGAMPGSGTEPDLAVGSTPNIAARLQALAEPGSIVISEATRWLLRGVFELDDLGNHPLKGVDAPVRAWRVRGVADAESRFEAGRIAPLGGLVGRQDECDTLMQLWRRAEAGQGQAVILRGEAGIGKSRLAAWLRGMVQDHAHTNLNFQCSPFHANTAFFPFISHLQRAAGFSSSDDTNRRLDRLEALLAISGPARLATAPLYAAMMSLPAGHRYPALRLSPAEQRQHMLTALIDHLAEFAAVRPMLVVFEDVHWADPTAIEALQMAVERIRHLPILLVITCRPEFVPNWGEPDHLTTLLLGRIAPEASRELAQQVAGGRSLPGELMHQILAKTDGIPLFVEEFTRTIVESGILEDRDGVLSLRTPLLGIEVPATLRDSLMARLDRLSPVKQVAQIGAAIGREFSYSMIMRVTGLDEPALRDALQRLEDAQLITSSGTPPEATYTFRHALVQDVAYDSMLRSVLRVLHGDIAHMLIEHMPQLVASEPATLAHHFSRAEMPSSAFEWWCKAGDQALLRSAYAEAIAHFDSALAIARTSADPAVTKTHLRIQTVYGQALIHARGWSAPETTAAFARARELASAITDSDERFQTAYGLWGGAFVRGELAPMREFSAAFVADTAERPGSVEYSVAQRALGQTAWFAGDYAGAQPALENALKAFDPSRDGGTGSRFGQDVGASAMLYLALTILPLGHLDRGRQLVAEALLRARASDHVPTLAYADFHACLFEAINGTPQAAEREAVELAKLCANHAMPVWAAASAVYSGNIAFAGGQEADGLAEIRRGTALFRLVGIGVFTPMNNALLAQAVHKVEGPVPAGNVIDAAIAAAGRAGQHWCDAEMYRLRSTIRQQAGDTSGAEQDRQRAHAITSEQGTVLFARRLQKHSETAG